MPPEKNPNQKPNTDLEKDVDKILEDSSNKKPVQKPIAPPPQSSSDNSGVQKPIKPVQDGDGNTPADQVRLDTLRTYKSDVNQTVQTDKITSAKVLMAEQKRREKEEKKVNKKSIKNPKNKLVLLLSVLFGIAGVIVIIFTVQNIISGIGGSDVPNLSKTAPDLFFVNQTEYLDVTDQPQTSILNSVSELLKKEYAEDSITDIVLFRVNEEDVSKKITSGSLMSLLQFNPPSLLTRSLSVEHILGVYRFSGENHPFLFIQINDFGNAFDSIFAYENNIAYDFRNIFDKFPDFNRLTTVRAERQEFLDQRDEELENATSTEDSSEEGIEDLETPVSSTVDDQTATSTATTTEKVLSIDDYNQQINELEQSVSKYRRFIDLIIQNVDTRSNVTEDGRVLMYYAFIDDKYLLFADNVEVLREINRRLREVNIVR